VFDLSNYLGAKVVNVIGQQMPVALPERIKIVELWMLEAETAGVELLFETHRNSLLNDLYYILQIMDSVPHMKICADLSHILVDREFRYPMLRPALIETVGPKLFEFEMESVSRGIFEAAGS